MGHVIHWKGRDWAKDNKEARLAFLAVLFLVIIILYFLYVFNRVLIAFNALGTNATFTEQVVFLLPHLLLLALFGTPVIRWFLKAIQFTPFYVNRKRTRRLNPTIDKKLKLKRFTIYYVVSFIVFLIAMFYLTIF